MIHNGDLCDLYVSVGFVRVMKHMSLERDGV